MQNDWIFGADFGDGGWGVGVFLVPPFPLSTGFRFPISFLLSLILTYDMNLHGKVMSKSEVCV